MQIHRSRTASFMYDLANTHTLSHSLSSLYTCNSHEICCFSTHQPIRFVHLVTRLLFVGLVQATTAHSDVRCSVVCACAVHKWKYTTSFQVFPSHAGAHTHTHTHTHTHSQQLYCRLTGHYINKLPDHVERHRKGKRFTSALDRCESYVYPRPLHTQTHLSCAASKVGYFCCGELSVYIFVYNNNAHNNDGL